MPWQVLILRSFSGVKLKQCNHTTFRVVLAQVVSLPLCFDKELNSLQKQMLELAPHSDGWAYGSSLASADGLHESSGTKRCIAMRSGHICKFFFTVTRTRHVLQWHLRFWCNCTAPSAATQGHNLHCLYFCPDFSLCYPHQHHYFTKALFQYF